MSRFLCNRTPRRLATIPISTHLQPISYRVYLDNQAPSFHAPITEHRLGRSLFVSDHLEAIHSQDHVVVHDDPSTECLYLLYGAASVWWELYFADAVLQFRRGACLSIVVSEGELVKAGLFFGSLELFMWGHGFKSKKILIATYFRPCEMGSSR